MEENKVFAALYDGYLELVNKAYSLCFMSCNCKLQTKICNDIDKYIEENCSKTKSELVNSGLEELATRVVVLEAQLGAVWHELNCLLCLKNDDAIEAWNHLVSAEDAVKAIGQLYGNAEGQFRRLRQLADTYFPKQFFMSAGFTIKSSQCSICSQEYDECDHILGKVYAGRFCRRIINEIEDLQEVSFILDEEPRDRRCRVTLIKENGIKFDLLTRQEEPVVDM